MTVSPILFWLLCAFAAVCSCILAVFIAAWIAQSRVIARQRDELKRVKALLDLTKQRSRKRQNVHAIRPRIVK